MDTISVVDIQETSVSAGNDIHPLHTASALHETGRHRTPAPDEAPNEAPTGQGPAAAVVNAGVAPVPDMSPVDSLYNAFTGTFGNENPMQLFSMVWPGTVLDAGTYLDNSSANDPLPALLEINQSTLFNQFYPMATITQADGTRVSDRYRSAIESYGPKPNAALINLQSIIRQRLDQTTSIEVNGVLQKVSLLDKYSILQERWIAKKQEWSRLKTEKLDAYRSSGGPDWWSQYITWYEAAAEGHVAAIDAAYNRMLADFPVNEFEDALAILDTHDAAALLRAKQEMRDAAIPVPNNLGASFYSTQAIPKNWGNALKPSSTFRDLLADPEAQQRYMDLCIDQLRQQIFSWNAVLAQIPDSNKSDIAAALADFNSASAKYFDATAQLVKDYGDNTVVAVKTYMQYKQGSAEEKKVNTQALKGKLDKSNPKGKGPDKPFDWGKVAEDINNGQKLLVDDTGSMVKSGQLLGEKATAYLNSRAGEGLREMIAPVLAKLQSQLAILVAQIRNFDSAASRAIQINGTGIASIPGESEQPMLASPVDDGFSQRWSEITIALDQSSMSSQSESSTSFSQSNWGVNFFFGSAGGQSKSASQQFASQFMDKESKIQIGMLATKVVIERPWMHPELFGMSNNFFKAVDTPVSSIRPIAKGELVASKLGGTVSQKDADENCVVLNQAILPGYPVALLLVKDVTIKISLKASETETLQKHAEQTSSSGGGFLCFSVSKTQASTSDSKSVSGYAMGGDFVFRIPAPQIVGVWNQIMPRDQSEYLTTDALERVLQFKQIKKQAEAVGAVKRHTEIRPTQPD